MSISARCFAIFLCAALPAHAQSTAKKPVAKTAPAKSTTARAPQGDVSPLPAPDVEFAAPVIVPARATAPVQTASAITAVEGDLAQFLSGKLVPLDIKLSDMKSGWQSLRVVRADEKSAEKSAIWPQDPLSKEMTSRFGAEGNRYFTQGRTLRFNDDVHLIVYRTQFPTFEQSDQWFEARFKGKKEPQLTEMIGLVREFLDTIPVRASLINTRNISAMEDVEAFDFETQFRAVADDLGAQFRQMEAQNQKAIANRKPVAPVSAEPEIKSRFQQWFLAIKKYAQDHDDKLPPMQDLAATRQAVDPYLSEKTAELKNFGIKLQPNALLSEKPMAHLKPYASSMILFYSSDDSTGGRWVLRLDGQVRQVSAAQWPQLKKAARIP